MKTEKKGKQLFSPVLPDFWNIVPFWKATTRLFLLIRATCSWIWAWSTGEMMIGENETTQRKTYPSAPLPATNLTWTDLNWTKPFAVISWPLTWTYITYNDLVGVSQRTVCASIMKTTWSMLFRKTVAFYCKNFTKYITALCGHNADYFSVLNLTVHMVTNRL
jgi:hypothetical protein